jgi:hypothetical protein
VGKERASPVVRFRWWDVVVERGQAVRIRFGTSHGTRQQPPLPSVTSAPRYLDSGVVVIPPCCGIDYGASNCGRLVWSVDDPQNNDVVAVGVAQQVKKPAASRIESAR